MEELWSDGDKQFRFQWRKRQEKQQGVIALKGLPYTWKSRLAELIGEWATCPVFCIDDFLCYQNQLAAAYDFSPSNSSGDEQVQRHHQHAFITLCAVAKRQLRPKFSGELFGSVVIKSRLTSTLELDQLTELTLGLQFGKTKFPLLIVECQMRNEFRWELRSRFFANRSRDWYRPLNWKEMEKARDEYYDPESRENWEDHLRQLVKGIDDDDPPLIRMLVLDPFSDLNFSPTKKNVGDLAADGFFDAVKYLLTADQEELNNQNPYVVEFDELRRFLFDRELEAAALRPRRRYLCPRGDCFFKYWTTLQDNEAKFCGVCEERVSGPAYTCYFCILTLHKSCAERVSIDPSVSSFTDKALLSFFYDYNRLKFMENHACHSCIQVGRDFSRDCGSCLFQTHLKCRLVPTIINHRCHKHFLSIQFRQHSFVCKACGTNYSAYSYGCKRCAHYYHLHCASLPKELKHEHGGYEHVMKLMYSRDGMEPEESYWCDFCYVDLDPQGWFYCCQVCPYYGAEPHCAGGYDITYANTLE